jgi:hypothetical protein
MRTEVIFRRIRTALDAPALKALEGNAHMAKIAELYIESEELLKV